ncbi:type 11 methyltransferase [Methanocaldococcus villosus KIN24-T80]|uniref:Type 11 methyltransferase n=3 Tax=Methanocaldococcus villosus TaxID=667126 RepID=N6VRT4_9EURY|nr:class I SAM-dependent methyltransferase [Methanocaldococcus villosus]ENN95876.1 type 11 methyltransferase [Methanocaldococcus villosus KIN24-T80]
MNFDKYYKEYDEWFEKNKEIYLKELNALKKYIPKGKGLEVGVGTGRFAQPLGIKYGLDPSKNMAKLAEERGVKVYIGYAENMPFEDNSFDFILLNTTLCFLKDVEKALKEIKRVLKPGGYLIIGMIDKNSKLGKIYEAKKDKSKFYKDANFFSLDEVIELLKRFGFKDIEYERVRLSEEDDGSYVIIRAK